MNGIHNTLAVRVCDTPQEAIDKGLVYRAPEYQPIRLTQAVVVRKGMVSGASTVDLILEDENGQKYVLLITRNLLDMIPS